MMAYGEIPLYPCTLSLDQNWTQHMAAKGVSDEGQQEAAELTITAVRRSGHIDASLKGSGVDRISAVAVSYPRHPPSYYRTVP